MSRPLLLALLVAACGVADAGLVGNGGLTAALDDFGSVTTCRWPGPAMNNQAGSRGARWATQTRQALVPVDKEGWEAAPVQPGSPGIHAVRINSKSGFVHALCETFVAPNHDVLTARLTLMGADPSTQLVWQPHFDPRAAVVPELAGLEAVLPSNARPLIYHRQSRRVYIYAPDLRSEEKSAGVWIIYGGRGSDFNMSVSNPALVFKTTSKDGAITAVVHVAFGKTRQEAEAAYDHAESNSLELLRQEVVGRWSPYGPEPNDWMTLLMSIDRQSGAFSRDPAAVGADFASYARDAAWAALALDLGGHMDAAASVLTFGASAVRREQGRARPRGSLPLACYSNGVEALPHLTLDADAPAYVLAGIWRHAQVETDQHRRDQFLSGLSEPVAQMADFLAAWTDGRNREPLYSFDPQKWRDIQGPERLLTTYMGIDAALRIMRELDQPEPQEWARRKVELDALIRFQLIDRQTGEWKAPCIVPFWHDLMAQDWNRRGYTLPSWDESLRQMLEDPTPMSAAAARLVWRNDPKRQTPIPVPTANNSLQAAQKLIAQLYQD